jgi:hypothetical protein
MNKTVLWILGIAGVVAVACALLAAGFFLGRAVWGGITAWPAGMMGYFSPDGPGARLYDYRPGQGMMGGGFGMMGPGMLGGYGFGRQGRAEPLSLEEAEDAVQRFLVEFGDPDLLLKEVMIFDNHAYAEIVEDSTGIGAMELLVDPVTLAVYPEHGPNMMWNLKYGMMGSQGGFGMMGGMMGGFGRRGFNPIPRQSGSGDMPVSPEEAVVAAQDYLDDYLPGTEVDEHADQFYGYYTLHILDEGKVAGMLSVNGFTAAVFPHTWHGDFIEMSEEEE